MLAQHYSMASIRKKRGGEQKILDKLERRRLLVRRRKRKKKKRFPYYESTKDFPHYFGDRKKHLYKGESNTLQLEDFSDYEPDFYEDKNYEYIDQEEIDTVKQNYQTNRKISETSSEQIKVIVFFTFSIKIKLLLPRISSSTSLP